MSFLSIYIPLIVFHVPTTTSHLFKSNACGQLGQSYQDYRCPAHEKHMECEVDPTMEITAVTHATWYGAPGTFTFL